MADEFSRDHMREKFRVEQKSVGEKAGLHLPWQSSARLPWLARPGFPQRFQNHVYRPDVTGASATASATGVGGAGASAPFAKKFKRDWTTSAPQHPSPAIPPSPRQNKDNSNISSSSSSIKSPVTSSSSSSSHTSSSSTVAHAATTQASSSNAANSSSIKSSSSGSIGSGSIGSGSLTFRRRTFTFEEFAALNSGDKTLTEADLRLKYERHKSEVLAANATEFFERHKHEEWFQRKYHPNEYQKRLEEKLSTVKKRRKVFERLMEMEMVDPIVLEVNRANNIVKVLDSAIVLMEGGGDEELKLLDQDESTYMPQMKQVDTQRAKPKPNMPAKFTEPLTLECEFNRKRKLSDVDMFSDRLNESKDDNDSISDSDVDDAIEMKMINEAVAVVKKDDDDDVKNDKIATTATTVAVGGLGGNASIVPTTDNNNNNNNNNNDNNDKDDDDKCDVKKIVVLAEVKNSGADNNNDNDITVKNDDDDKDNIKNDNDANKNIVGDDDDDDVTMTPIKDEVYPPKSDDDDDDFNQDHRYRGDGNDNDGNVDHHHHHQQQQPGGDDDDYNRRYDSPRPFSPPTPLSTNSPSIADDDNIDAAVAAVNTTTAATVATSAVADAGTTEDACNRNVDTGCNVNDVNSNRSSSSTTTTTTTTAAIVATATAAAAGSNEPTFQVPKLIPLHKTVSLFIKDLPATTTIKEVEDICKNYPGYMRLVLQDPMPPHFTRRGWVTFQPWVNVKDVCWSLIGHKIGNKEISVTVNSELKQRVRPVNGVSNHKLVAKQDIKNIVKIIQNLDTLYDVWGDSEGGERGKNGREMLGFISKNPLLKNITEYLVDEGSYEEEALLDNAGSYWDEYDERPKPAHAEVFIEKDVNMLKALDRMILYLRVVHSFDYYVSSEYTSEDIMPHVCGIIHVRALRPNHKVTQSDVNEWMSGLDKKLSTYMNEGMYIPDDLYANVSRHYDAEVSKFIKANTIELAKDKWLCPLSGKKFKGADFVSKHIRTKHTDKLDIIKTEVDYFNNYIRDARRPQLPEQSSPVAPATTPTSTSTSSSSSSSTASSANMLPNQKHKSPLLSSSSSMLPPPASTFLPASLSVAAAVPHLPHLHPPHLQMMPRYPSFSVSLASQAPFRPPHPPPPPPHHYHPFYRAPMAANYSSRSHSQDDTYRPRDRYVPRRGRGYYRAGSNM